MTSTYHKSYTEDFIKFKEFISKKIPFTLSRFNDGELSIINNIPYKASRHHGDREFIFDGTDKHTQFRHELLTAYMYDHPTYYTGIVCPCCTSPEIHAHAKETINRDDNVLTWANIFVNGNNAKFLDTVVPLFNTYDDIVMVCNELAQPSLLPFIDKVADIYTIPNTAWLHSDIIEKIKPRVSRTTTGSLYLFAAGPVANVLAMECNKINPSNTYIDIGSTLDGCLGLGKTRGYHKKVNKFKDRICTWIT